ncbi:MAG: response regulator [Deltaproteobacteria bacterium]|nr:response regulator [Deltaproteobacteria bacterium]
MPAILAVDDNPANLLAVEAALGDLSDGLVTAGSGREALRLLLDRDFAVVLLDVKMPTMDGFETAELIRSRPRSRHLPIIFVTAYGRDETAMLRGYDLGAVDFLYKPIVPEILRAKVEVFVELQRQAARLQAMERRSHEQHMADAKRRWEADELRRDNERKDQFIAMLAHELRNPLMPIVTAVELLKGSPDPETIDHARDAMERQLGTLRRLVDDLLDIARVTSGKLTLRRSRLDLRSVVQQAVDANRRSVDEHGQELTVHLPTEELAVDGDEVRLAQVVSNLIGNASRYSEPGGKIEVRSWADDAGVHVRVADDGRGIPEDLLPRIFGAFVQGADGAQGLGLGLSLVKRLVDLHGGTVEVSSEGEGKGSTFEVVLQRDTRLRDTGSLPQVPKPTPPPTDPGLDLSLHIHLVDDEDDIRETMRMLLERWGHRVADISSPVAAIERVVAESPDVVIVDLGMPEMDGLTVARTLRERCSNQPRLIAVTGYGSPEDRRQTAEAGFDQHLVKPVEPEELRRVLHDIAKQRATEGRRGR